SEHALLHVRTVTTNRPAPVRVPVTDEIVGMCPCVTRIGLEAVPPFRRRRAEGVVHGRPATPPDRDVVAVVDRFEQWRIHDPYERPFVLVDEVELLRDGHPGGTEQTPRS